MLNDYAEFEPVLKVIKEFQKEGFVGDFYVDNKFIETGKVMYGEYKCILFKYGKRSFENLPKEYEGFSDRIKFNNVLSILSMKINGIKSGIPDYCLITNLSDDDMDELDSYTLFKEGM